MGLIDVVKWDEPAGLFVYKHPETELSTLTQLIVNESQEAILFKGGQRMDIFGPGRHTLSTGNIPILNHLINLPFGGTSPFTAEVWFVDKSVQLDMKWGTATPILLEDPIYGVIIPVRAFGQFGLKIADSGRFVGKIVGARSDFSRAAMDQYLRGLLMTQIKDSLSEAMIERSVSILEISSQLIELSQGVQKRVTEEFERYGLSVESLKIISIDVPEDDDAFAMLKDAKSLAAKRKIEGFSYQQQRTFDVLEAAAQNEGDTAQGLIGAGMGLGMGVGVGNLMGNMMGTAMTPGPPPAPTASPVPGPAVPNQVAVHVIVNGQTIGPLNISAFGQYVAAGQVTAQSLVWLAGMPAWQTASSVAALAGFFTPPPPPPTSSPTGNTED